jgi:hypothetical protein
MREPDPPIKIITTELAGILVRCNAPATAANNPTAMHQHAARIVTALVRSGYQIRKRRSEAA